MLKVDFELKGLAPLQFSKYIAEKKNTGESHDAFEKRSWMQRLHVGADGNCFVPPQAIKGGLESCARFLSESVPGKGMAKYTKHFKAGIMCTDPILLFNGGKPLTAKDVHPLELFVPSDGRKGGGSRVMKVFPTLSDWTAIGTLYVLDPLLIDKPEKIEEYMRHAGQFIGMLAFRPENGGYFGRYEVTKFEYSDVA